MSQFFYINSSVSDGAGMTVKWRESSGSSSLRKSSSRPSDGLGRFPSTIIPWKQEEMDAIQRPIRGTVIQRSIPTDFIEAGKSYESHFYVTKRVVEALDKSGLKGWAVAASKFRVINRNGEFLREEVFFDIIPLGEAPVCNTEYWEKIVINGKDSGYGKSIDQTEDALKKREAGSVFRRFLPDGKTWEGHHFMFQPGPYAFTGRLICSREVVQLAHQEQWTNAAFQLLDMLDRDYSDFRLRCWPPEKWYPRWHPNYNPVLHEQGECPDPSAKHKKMLDEMRENHPAWISLEDFQTFEEQLAYVRRHAVILSKAPMEHPADVTFRLHRFLEIRQMLESIPEGSADAGLLLAALLEADSSEEFNTKWYQSLGPKRQSDMRQLLLEPPDELIDELMLCLSIRAADQRRELARRLGLDLVIPNRECDED